MFPSVTLILSGVFTAYILHSIWTIYSVYNPTPCNSKLELCLNPSWKENDVFQLFLCTSLSDHPLGSKLNCVWQNDNFQLNKHTDPIPLSIQLPQSVINNGSYYMHAILTTLRSTREVTSSVITHQNTYVTTSPLTKYVPKQAETFNLLNKPSSEGKKDDNAQSKSRRKKNNNENPPVTHWKPKLVLNVVSYPLSLSRRALPAEIAHLIKLTPKKEFLPIVYISQVRQRSKDLWPVNQSLASYPLEVVYEPISIGKLRFMVIIETSLGTLNTLGFSELDTDDVKGIFFDTNLYLLLVTVFATSFHVLFDFLAFKNDIKFWHGRKTMSGISFSSLVWRCISQFIITLYLLDQNTSLLVLIPSCIATIIEIWKLKKALKVNFTGWSFKFTMSTRNAKELETDDYDKTFMKYMAVVLVPLVIGGAIYSIIYTQHKSWLSWVIQSAANFVYAFGFIMMTPQLFINYKLKSVAHLNFRTFMYKAFNTFIDDLFAFLITSIPWSHRVAAFRDDIVFLIFLYQRWLYPVDKSRINEFGETQEEKKGDGDNKKTN